MTHPAPYLTEMRYAASLTGTLDAGRVGQKAANLGRMRALDLPVPEGFVLTGDALGLFLDESGLRRPVSEIVENLRLDDPTGLKSASSDIRTMLLAAQIPEPVLDELHRMCRETMADGHLAVRSSAIGEDSPDSSYAGQLDSYLDVMPGHDLVEAVIKCWASLWGVRALTYGLARGRRLDGMGVIVQALVPAEFSGVLFTVSPVRGQEVQTLEAQTMIGEYCAGYGVAVVSGARNPGRFSLGRTDHQIAGTVPLGLPGEAAFLQSLARADLGAMAMRLEREFGTPQDIEWSLDAAGRLFLLQSRPITALDTDETSGTGRGSGIDSKGDAGPIRWSNANVNENFPGPISPFLYSVARTGYYFYFRNLARSFGVPRDRLQAMEYPLRQIIGVHGARMYYNLTSIRRVLQLTPCGPLLAEFFDRFVGTDTYLTESDTAEDQGTEKVGRVSHLRSRLFLTRFLLAVVGQYLFLGRKIERFERVADAFALATRPDTLRDRTALGLRDDLRAFLQIRCHRWNDAALADAAAMASFGVLNRLLKGALPDEDPSRVSHSLLEGLPGVVSVGSVVELWDLAVEIRENPELRTLVESMDSRVILERIRTDPGFREFRLTFERYLDKWGFRCSGELMLTVPSFQEKPAPLIDILKSYLRMEKSPRHVIEESRERSLAETRRVIERLTQGRSPSTRVFGPLLFRTIVGATQGSIRYRERARLKQALIYSRLRRVVLALGERLVESGEILDRDDVFFLTHEELEEWLTGRSMFPGCTSELVAYRKKAHGEISQRKPPPSFTIPEGAYSSSGARAPASGEEEETGEGLLGISACGGRAVGPARVLEDVTEAHLLGSEDILVTEQTDPGWGPAFFIVRGLVMERGGMLSHGAILAREFGIPAVVGVEGATRRIADGARIVVRGEAGRVDLVD